jgi:hypothetical protein
MKAIILIALTLVLLGCNDEATEIGSDFFSEGSLDVSYIDSSTVNLSTVRFESVVTNTTSRIVLGTAIDEKLGRVTASTFFQAGLSSAFSLEDKNVEYAYSSIVLTYDEYFYYDTTTSLTLKVHLLSESIELSDEGYLRNTDSFTFQEDVLGSSTFSPRPHRDDSVEIKLNDTFGRVLYNKAVEGHSDLESNSNFIDLIKGFAIIPDTLSSASMIGFLASPELRLYYWDKSLVPAVLTFKSFPVNTGYISTHFHTNYRYGLKSLAAEENLPSSASDGISFIQGGAGLALRVDIPYLRELKQNTNFYVTKASLEIYPQENSYNKTTPLPDLLVAYQVNTSNSVYSESIYYSTLNPDVDLDRDTGYTLDITAFVKEQMELQEFNDNALLFALNGEAFNTGADRIYFTSKNAKQKPKLKIYYATINK